MDAVAYDLRMALQETGSKGTSRGPITLIVTPFLREGASAVAVYRFLEEQIDTLGKAARPIIDLHL